MPDLLESGGITGRARPTATTASEAVPGQRAPSAGGQEPQPSARFHLLDLKLLREHGVLSEAEFAAEKRRMRAQRRRFQLEPRPDEQVDPRR
jgi:hypothetical protein